jgi:hypothetical protein
MCNIYRCDETIEVESYPITSELMAHLEVCEECKDRFVETILLLITEVESEKVS